MRIYEGVVREVQWQGSQGQAAWIECPKAAIPPAGRYVMAWSPEDTEASLATPLFAARIEADGFQAAAPIPGRWEPGTQLELRGPLGHGFKPSGNLRRLALAGLEGSMAYLQPLMQNALDQGAAVALFTDHAVPGLPSAVEVNPLEMLEEALTWADYLAVDLPPQAIPELGHLLGLERGRQNLPCPAQALVHLAMPCGGMAGCGACALETRLGWKLACEDGPVFDLINLLPKG
jgi:Iron-sulfur cluster binding domain of dihydroorotate dehydrogenase B